jgi:hypothetical protein
MGFYLVAMVLQQDTVHKAAQTMKGTLHTKKKERSNAVPITGRGGLQGCEMSSIPHRLNNRFIDGS